MASVLHLSQLQPITNANHLFSDMEPLSLSLDLSLGGLFSKRSLKASPNSESFPVKDLKACAMPPVGSINSQWDAPASVDGAPIAVVHEPADHFETRSLQAQRRHEARKRRKNIIEGKLLHKRAKGDFQIREELTRPSNAQYLEFLTPCCDDQGKVKFFTDEAGKRDLMFSSGIVESKDVPGAMVDFMSVLGFVKDARMGRNSAEVSPDVDVDVDGDASSVLQPSHSLHHVMPSESMLKQDRSFDVQHRLNGDVICSVQYPSSLSSTSSGFSHLTASCGPCESRQNAQIDPNARSWLSENAHCPEVPIRTCGSSSQLLPLHAGEKFDNKHSHNGSSDNISACLDKSCNSSSSEIEDDCNESVQIHKSRRKLEDQAELEEQPTETMPAVYPPFPVMPLPYSYGLPLPWGFSLPWYTQGLSQNVFGIPMSCPPSVVQSKEAFVPFGGLGSPYCLPVPGSNSTPWLPFPTGVGTSTSSENSIPVHSSGELYKSSHPGHKAQDMSGSGQDIEGKGDLMCALDMRAETMEGDREGNVVTEVQGQNAQAMHVALDEPMKEKLKEPGFFIRDGKSSARSQPGKQPEKGCTFSGDSLKVIARLGKDESERERQADFEKHVAAGRQQSLPLANETVSKKRKVVRFNSIDGAGVRMSNEAFQSADGNDRISTQQCVGALDCSTQTGAVPSNIELSRNEGPKGSCGDGRQNFSTIEGHMRVNSNLRAGDGYSADDVMQSDNTAVDGEIDGENLEGDGCAISQPCKCAIKDSLGGSQSRTSLLRVITHGSGPHGKTVHGDMYITKGKQARLICACHGKHMSPLEFVQHSGSSDLSNPERRIVLESFSYVDDDIRVPA